MIALTYDQMYKIGPSDTFLLSIINKLQIHHLADLGCGTGRLTSHLDRQGYKITAIDPDEEAIAVAENKGLSNVQWLVGDDRFLQPNTYDAVIMTANVAQVFLTDESWEQTLSHIYQALQPKGSLIFDCRNLLAKEWKKWMADETPDYTNHPQTGEKLTIISTYDGMKDDIFTFYESVQYDDSGELITRRKYQLRFRTYEDIENSLRKAGFTIKSCYGDYQFKQAKADAHVFIFHCIK